MDSDEVQVEVWQLGRDEEGRDVVLLRADENRHLPMWIGPCEAAAIWMKLRQEEAREIVRRPMTHDLLASVLERLGAKLERVVIDDYWRGTYYSRLLLTVNGDQLSVDSRPSDAIALALRCGSPIFVTERVLTAVAQSPDESADEGQLPGDADNPLPRDLEDDSPEA
jgi:bifunctional DNase/RNase